MRISRKIYLIALFTANFLSGFAQDDSKKMAEDFLALANSTYFETRALNQANELYVQAATFDPENIEANYMAGRTSLETNLKSDASIYLLRVLDLAPNHKFNLMFMIGQGFQYGMEFEKAIDYYYQYLEKVSQNPRKSGEDVTPKEEVERKIYECQNGIEYVNNPGDFIIENAGSTINSEWDDFAPVVNKDETFMAFTTRRQDENTNADVFDDMLYYEDVFYSERSGDKWMYARNIGPPVNIRYHSSNLAISADGKELYLFKSQNGGDIFLSKKNTDGTWTEPEPLNGNVNSTFFENSASISPDGKTLYFSSNRPISADKLDLDIYYSQKDRKGEWGPAKNIGAVINTEFDDDGPFIDSDGKTLYFSSKGHKGMGGFDIFRTVYDKDTDEWSEPVNLGYPMNSPDNDNYFVSAGDGKRGYYSSAKAGGEGFTDIYHVKLPDDMDNLRAQSKKVEQPDLEKPDLTKVEKQEVVEPVVEPVVEQAKPVILVLKTIDKLTNNAIDVDVSITKAENSRSVSVSRIGNGTYQAQFTEEASSKYTITIQKSGYMYKNIALTVPPMTINENKITRQVTLDKIKVGYSQVVRNIYFDFGTARLQSTSDPELNKLLKVIEENSQYVIEISGHTDNVGPKDFNQWLSKRRAQSIVNYMVKNGQSDGRFLVEGYGEDKPLASNDDEEWGREFNRRVEFKVLKFK